ncbi:MAG: hypothetical protein ACYCPP_03510 [Nitrososphaerales archaeon]
MSFVLWNHVLDFARFLTQKMDWRYFHLTIFASGLYLFNIIVVSLSNGRFTLLHSTLTSTLTNFPLLTLVYITALLELMDMKVLVGGAVSKFKKKNIVRNQSK